MVTVIRAFQSYRRGQSLDVPDGMANVLINRGLVEQAAVLETPERNSVSRSQMETRRRGRRKTA